MRRGRCTISATLPEIVPANAYQVMKAKPVRMPICVAVRWSSGMIKLANEMIRLRSQKSSKLSPQSRLSTPHRSNTPDVGRLGEACAALRHVSRPLLCTPIVRDLARNGTCVDG